MSWLRSHWKAAVLTLVLFAVGIGLGIAAGGTKTKTETAVVTTVKVKTRTQRIVRTKTVRVQPTITRTETVVHTTVVTQPPTSSFLDYGEWRGNFTAYAINGYDDSASGTGWRVVGQLEYLGGIANCGRISYIQIDGTFFKAGQIAATAFTNMTSMPQGSRVPFEITALDQSGDFRYELLITNVTCDT